MPSLSGALLWIQQHYTEIFAVITGLLYVFFAIRGNILLWFFGIVSSALYVGIFMHAGIFAYAVLYVYYVLIGIYGWYKWRSTAGKSETGTKNSILRTPAFHLGIYLLAIIVLAVPIYFALKGFTTSDMPLIDAVLTSGGIVATWMLTQKYIEQWLFWIIINLVSCGAMIYKELYPSAFLFLVYALMAVLGYVQWNKELKAS